MTVNHTKRCWFQRSYLSDNLSSLRSLQHRCWMSNQDAADFLGVTLRTYRRWLKAKPPEWARLLMAIRAGYVPWDGWQDWQMVDDGIIPPGYRDVVTPGQIMAVPFRLQQLRELKRQIRQFAELDDQAEFNHEILRRHLADSEPDSGG